MVDSHLPRFSQAVQAVLLVIAFALEARGIVVVLALILLGAVIGGARFNLLAYAYKGLAIPRGELEPAAPPRFAQTIGTGLLIIASVVLFAASPHSGPWWFFGWGPALVVAALSALAAASGFCLGCEIYVALGRMRARGQAEA